MTDTRTFSISDHNGPKRNESIAADDVHHLARVDTAIAAEAARATQSEISMTLSQGIKTYPKAIGWSVLLSTCIIMEGFDIVLINSLMALPAFQRRFGEPSPDGGYQISAAWQSGLSNGALVGEVIGLLFIGYIVERVGYKKTMIGSLIALTGFIFIVFFAQSLPMLLVGEILMGIPWTFRGAFQTLTTTYAAEVCPVSLRAYLTTYVNLCWVIGQFLSSAVLKSVANKTGPIGYKLPYGLQWIWPLPLIIGIALAPESPWWLVRKGRPDEAKKQVLRLTSRNQTDSGFNVDETVNMMIYTDELEKAHTTGTSYWDCFRGTDRRRTEIVCMVWAVQTLCGASSFTGYSTYFFEQAGLDVSSAFSMSLGQYGLGAVGTILSWLLMLKFGRRTLYLWGQIAMAFILMVVGFLGIAPASAAGAHWGIGALILIYTFIYDMTVGPVCYSLVAEIPSTRLRNKTVVLARNLYNITGVVANVLTPHMLNPDAWNWGAKAGFFWAGTGALCAVWTYFRVPEPKGRTYAEMDMLFDAHTSARKFKETSVESFGSMTKLENDKVMSEKSTSDHVEEVGC
ncbi:sugar porter family MFS transporter [Aureobasidium pullulans]|uniref:Sugar porter family MFS transporter n=1 Tax=Aureobasidium pullulans TaxID=5580 RepID=A0A4S9QKB8_AURPU|nr:sugar porter family MFS transporter [Aureobasidium pullulans]THW99279.1 sugar porter family MFS transporter [Aureobasidium pullulans]THY57252.1 sugar porter family MFS transporter [Aureobasidium pullulans]THY83662.1 sugar porter family MFS transporter [Aureobasidium pullulans]THY91462.1 sugar porter family MFS transporter [Aureobasidium pullulans]